MIRVLDRIGSLLVLPGLALAKLVFLGFAELAADAATLTVSFNKPYKMLLLLCRVAGYSGGGSIARWQFNGDQASNYGAVASEPQDAAATSTINAAGILVGETAQTTPRPLLVAFVLKEAAGRVAKLAGLGIDESEAIGTAVVMTQHGGLWGNTTALITSVSINGNAVNLLAGTHLTVFGIDYPTA